MRELVARRVPLYRFVLANVVSQATTSTGPTAASTPLREAARLVVEHPRPVQGRRVRPRARRHGRRRRRARPAREVRRAASRPRRATAAPARGRRAASRRRRPAAPQLPDLRDPRFALERETLKLVVQQPDGRRPHDRRRRRRRLHPPDLPRGLGAGRRSAAGPAAAPTTRLGRPAARRARPTRPSSPRCQRAGGRAAAATQGARRRRTSRQHVFRLQELTAQRRIADVKSRLQRTNPVEQAAEYNRMFGELAALEQHRRTAPRPGAGAPSEPVAVGRAATRRSRSRRRAAARLGRRVDGRPWSPAPATRSTCPRRRPSAALGAGRGRRLGPRRPARCGSAEVGSWGEPRPEHARLDARPDPDRLLQLVRERVTASVLLQRHVAVDRPARRPRGRPPGAVRALGGPLGLRVRRGRRPRRPVRPGRPPRPPWPRAEPTSALVSAPAGRSRFAARRAALLICAGSTIPCSSTGRAFGC